MSVLIDIEVAQLLCSRLCHDLISPVGAVNTGMELVQENDPATRDEALALVAESGRQAARRLAFYRAAFGKGGGDGVMSAAQVRDLAAGLLSEGPVGLIWPDEPPAGPGLAIHKGVARLLLNLILLAVEALPRGGTVTVRLAPLPEGLGAALSAAGPGARFRDDLRETMSPVVPVEDLTARTVQGHFTARLADALGVAVEIADDGAGEVRLAALLPVPSVA
jgi:histidine phosphotransferase ChpT